MRTNLLNFGLKVVLVALILVAMSVSASAQWPCYYNGYGDNGYYSYYSSGSPPYFAIHPPVYYSYPVSRTYGLYPFPYYAEATPATVPVVEVEPKILINPYVDQKAAVESNTYQTQPLRIMNPYVEQRHDPKSIEKGRAESAKTVKPKIIYPIKNS